MVNITRHDRCLKTKKLQAYVKGNFFAIPSGLLISFIPIIHFRSKLIICSVKASCGRLMQHFTLADVKIWYGLWLWFRKKSKISPWQMKTYLGGTAVKALRQKLDLLNDFDFARHFNDSQKGSGVQRPNVKEPAHTASDQKSAISEKTRKDVKTQHRKYL